jgi:XRE family transcriptional regulator, fatty acid utilization regulator
MPRRSSSPGARALQRTVGRNVQHLRLRAGLTVEALAAQVGLQPGQLKRIEDGEANPTVELLDRLGKVLGVAAVDLLASDVPQ